MVAVKLESYAATRKHEGKRSRQDGARIYDQTAHSSATKPIRRGVDFMRAQFQSSWKSKYDLKLKKK